MEFITQGAMRRQMAEDLPDGTARYLTETIGLREVGDRD